MRRPRLPLVVLACLAALGMVWIASRGSVRKLAPLDAVTTESSTSAPSEGPGLLDPTGPSGDRDADPGNRVDAVAEARAAKRRAPHPNPPWATIHARLVVAGEPGPLVAVPVRYEHGRRSWRMGTTSATAGLETRLSRPGSYRFYVDPKALPETYALVDPRRSGRLGAFPGRTETVDLEAGRRFEAEVYVFEGRRLSGQVVDANGVPVEGARVLLDDLVEGTPRQINGRTTDRYGRFAFLQLLPMPHQLRLEGPPDSDSVGLGIPPPVACDLREWSLEHQRIAFGSGGVNVRGRVVDPEGVPISGLFVRARYLEERPVARRRDRSGELTPNVVATSSSGAEAPRTRTGPIGGGTRVVTNADGEFTFLGLQPRAVRVDLGPDGPAAGPHTKPVAASSTVNLDLTSEEDGEHDLGARVLERRNDFELSGRVVLTAKRHEGRRLRMRRVQVTARYGPEATERIDLDKRQVQVDPETGEFTVHGDPGVELIELRVHVWPAEDHVTSSTFSVSPRGVQRDLVLEHP